MSTRTATRILQNRTFQHVYFHRPASILPSRAYAAAAATATTTAAAPAHAHAPVPPPTSAPQQQLQVDAQSQTQRVRYPFFVTRTPSGFLPVYSDIRNGGSSYRILIRNIDGDLQAFVNLLREQLYAGSDEALRIAQSHLRVRTRSGRHVELAGVRPEARRRVAEWLKHLGF